MGTLYVVATPIGNLEDITLRALRILSEVGVIAAEDTRRTGILLRRHGIRRPMLSCRAENEKRVAERLMAHLETEDVALVTDAGTPVLSDPGERVVAAAIAAGHPVVPLPGASAITAAVAVSGIPASTFTFAGFLPRKQGELARLFQRQESAEGALVAFESPFRLVRTLLALAEALPDRQVAVARELTKVHEEVRRGRPEDLLEHYRRATPKGELTLVIQGLPRSRPATM
ncbi:MAG: 16S rRNA (cytidine(1402)-2'-O)-methyltransferase [Candidatus Dormibacteria bacterium]